MARADNFHRQSSPTTPKDASENYNQIMSRSFIAPLILSCALLTACDSAEQPAASWESAVQGVYTAALSNDGAHGIVGSIQHGGSLWDMVKKERLYNWNHAQGAYTGLVAAAFSPDGYYAATADHRNIVLWQTDNGEPIWFWTAPGDVLSMDLTPNGDFALLGLDDYSAVIFDIKNGGVKRKFQHQGKVRTVSLSDDGKFVLTGSDDRTAKLWDLQSGELLHTWQHDNQLVTVALSSSGKYAFTAAQADKAIIWNTATGQAVKEMPVKKGPYIAGAAYTAARFFRQRTGITDRHQQPIGAAVGAAISGKQT